MDTRKKKTLIGLALTLAMLLVAAFPLFGPRYIPTHDGEYHIIRFIEFFRMLGDGYWFPRWAPTLNSGYGIPIFLFHYPFPNYVGSLLIALGANAVNAFKLGMALGYITAGIACFFWLRKLFGVKAAVTGTVVASLVPYWFVDLYVRGSVGEVWAIAFLFLGLLFGEYRRTIAVSLAVAGLILSHNILSMLFLPFLFAVFLIRNRKASIGILYGVLLSAYFWMPALLERYYVVGLNTVNFREHFALVYELLIPSWGTELSGQTFGGNKMSFQIGILPLIAFFWTLLLIRNIPKGSRRELLLFFVAAGIASVFLMLGVSAPVWDAVPLLPLFQYPWRLLSLVIPVTALSAAVVSSMNRKRIVSIVMIAAAFLLAYPYTRPVTYEPRDTAYYLARKNFTDGTSSMGNSFSTIWASWKRERPGYIVRVDNGSVSGGFVRNTYLEKTFSVEAEPGAKVYLPLLYFPGWKAQAGKKEMPIEYQLDGTVQFRVPPGHHEVRVQFGETDWRRISDMISLITLVWLIGWGILGLYARGHKYVADKRRAR